MIYTNKKPPRLARVLSDLFFDNYDLFNDIALTDGINHFEAFVNLAEAGVFAVEVRSISATVANEKL